VKMKLLLILLFLPVMGFAQTYSYSTFYNFQEGNAPSASLLIDDSGNLYGISSGGTYQLGEVYKITSKGAFSTLYSFTTSDGSPDSLIRSASNGDFYGVYSGDGGDTGGVFKLTDKKGKYTYSVLYANPDFSPDYGDGNGGVALDSKGNIYGAADLCSSAGWLCIFEISTRGEWTDLVDICCAGEDNVTSNVILDENGFVYVGIGYEGIAGFGWIQESSGIHTIAVPAMLARCDRTLPETYT
jgi:uncharacterized repeat protein (TIGR03803 family)